MVRDFFQGLFCYRVAFTTIRKNNLGRYMVIPGVISSLYIFLLLSLGIIYMDNIASFFNSLMPQSIQQGIAGTIIRITLMLFLWIALLLFCYVTVKVVALTACAPFNSMLSEKVEFCIRNTQPQGSEIMREVYRSFILTLYGLTRSVKMLFIGLAINLIPVIGQTAATICIFLSQAFQSGNELVDYTLERKRFSIGDTIEFSRRNRGLITGVGAGFVLLLMIPVFGWVLGPGLGVTAATIAALERTDRE